MNVISLKVSRFDNQSVELEGWDVSHMSTNTGCLSGSQFEIISGSTRYVLSFHTCFETQFQGTPYISVLKVSVVIFMPLLAGLHLGKLNRR